MSNNELSKPVEQGDVYYLACMLSGQIFAVTSLLLNKHGDWTLAVLMLVMAIVAFGIAIASTYEEHYRMVWSVIFNE